VTSLAGRIGMAIFTIPYFSFGAQLSHDYRERTSISAIRGILILVSTLVAASLSFVLFFPNVTPGIDPKLNGAGYFWMGLVFGIVISATGIVSVLGTGREAAAARELVPQREESSYSPAYLLASLRNPSFRLIIASFFLFFMGVVFNSALAIHYLTYYTGIGSSAALSSFQLAFYLGSVVGLVAWLKLARWADKHVLYGCAALASAVLMLGAVLLVGEGRLLGTGSARVMLIGHWIGGCLTSIVWFIPQSMIADVCDEEELVSGERREGMFFGLFYLARQLAVGLTSLLAGVLLDWYAGLESGAVAQSGQTVSRIGILFGVYPAIALALGGVLMLRYTLSARRVAAIRVELNNRRSLAACR
jgi:GPH family glycoside/pentoside/hexuronide:cation symporter